MNKNIVEQLIKESFKDLAIRLFDLNDEDRKHLLAEYKEWIIGEINLGEIMMLPYEAYPDRAEENLNDDSI